MNSAVFRGAYHDICNLKEAQKEEWAKNTQFSSKTKNLIAFLLREVNLCEKFGAKGAEKIHSLIVHYFLVKIIKTSIL